MITDRLKKWPKTPDLFSFCLKLPMMLCEDIPQLRVAPPSSRWNSLCKSFRWKNSRLHRPSTLFILHRIKSIFTQRICNKDKIANPVFLGKRINHRSTSLTQMFLHGKTCFKTQLWSQFCEKPLRWNWHGGTPAWMIRILPKCIQLGWHKRLSSFQQVNFQRDLSCFLFQFFLCLFNKQKLAEKGR